MGLVAWLVPADLKSIIEGLISEFFLQGTVLHAPIVPELYSFDNSDQIGLQWLNCLFPLIECKCLLGYGIRFITESNAKYGALL